MNWRAILTGFVIAVAILAVGVLVNLPALGLFGGTAAGSYFAARSAGHMGAAHGAVVAGFLLVAAVVVLAVGRQTFPNMDSINATSLAWAGAVLLLGTAMGLVARGWARPTTT